jgi:hypothetical protein
LRLERKGYAGAIAEAGRDRYDSERQTLGKAGMRVLDWTSDRDVQRHQRLAKLARARSASH